MRARRWRDLAAVALAVTSVATACADDGPPGTAPAATTTTSAAPVTAAGSGPATTEAPDTGAAGAPAVTDPATSAPAATDPTAPPTDPAAPPTDPAAPPTDPPPTGEPTTPRPPLTNADGENQAFSGIGRLAGLGSSCTAWLLDVGEPSGPAYALTNGHCVGLDDSTTTVRDQPVDGATVRFRSFADTPSDVAEVPVETVRYATARGADVAVLELGTTRSGVIGLASYALAAPPADGEAIRVVGVPVADGPDDEVLRGDTCTAGPTVRLVESEWLWDEAIATDCWGILDGSAGSPVFDADDPRRVVGIVTTTTIGAGPGATCARGQPCELPTTGATRRDDRSYALPVAGWDACFTPEWDPSADGCPAEAAPVAVDAPLRAVRPGSTWAATVTGGGGGAVVAKSGPAGTTDCRDAAGYAPPPVDGLGAVPLPAEEGVAVLCAAELDARGTPRTADAGYAVMVVDATAPDVPIRLSRSDTAAGVRVGPVPAPPELSSFEAKVGPGGAVDCADPAGYATAPAPVVVPADDLPATLCVVGVDEAGNKGVPQSFELS